MAKINEPTKLKLLEAALVLFTEKGYHETKVSDIVKRAGVAQGTFYLYFQSKETIFTSIIENTNAAILEQVETIFADQVNPNMPKEELKQKLFETITECMTLYRNHRGIMYLLRMHSTTHFPEAEKVVADCRRSMLDIIMKLFRKFHLFPDYDTFQFEVAATAIDGLLNETCLQYLILKESAEGDIEKIARVVTGMIYDMTLGRENV
ncbi:TetR/AcrR family transcriptional regulator [Paenibacillus caseinilyticus]|nr:TetR/AcrR family transcriptional regulator [Paenibacillus caseinilyticus]